MEFVGRDQGGDLGLRFTNAPWRPVAFAHFGGLAPVSGFEHFLGWLSHAIQGINAPDIYQSVYA